MNKLVLIQNGIHYELSPLLPPSIDAGKAMITATNHLPMYLDARRMECRSCKHKFLDSCKCENYAWCENYEYDGETDK